ncbi:MAG: GDSL family lipase [Clostridia bacterium]|nr:GDSL family lipase [Clostridia bacterium]
MEKKKIKILFQGDSITDAWREEGDTDYHRLGKNYPKYAAEYLTEAYPSVEFEFLNLGRGGSQIGNLLDRLQEDFLDIGADVVSILIGINDVWGRVETKNWVPKEEFVGKYRKILEALKARGTKIMLMEPFVFPHKNTVVFREDLDFKIDAIRELALEYADAYLPTDGLFYSAFMTEDSNSFTDDCIHPNAHGSEFIGRKYAEYIRPIIDNLIKE